MVLNDKYHIGKVGNTMETYILVWYNGDREIRSYSEIDRYFKVRPCLGFKVYCRYQGEEMLVGEWTGKKMK